jgi:hypothetical protein
MHVPHYDGVYFINRAATRVTFHSQQQRALNLAWALSECGKLGKDVNVAVVGAGLTGLTFAFAAAEKEATVTLIEEKRIPLYLQRGCQLRFIHPNIYEWPDPISDNPLTDLPCLNWGADYAARVCDTVLWQWKEKEKKVTTLYGYEVKGLRSEGERTLILAEGARNHREIYDFVILAVGFGLETSTPGVQFLSYWENDNFGRAVISPPIPRRYVVSGCGDGGLIDALRLSINTFDHAWFVRLLQYEPELDKIKQELLEIDKRVAQKCSGSADRQGELLEQEYDRLSVSIPPSLVKTIQDVLREDTVVYLNDEKPFPFTLRSAILNRFGVYLLLKYGGLRFRAGRPAIEGERGGPYRVRLGAEGELLVDEVVIRYGPESAVGRFLPSAAMKEMTDNPPAVADRTREPHYGNFLASEELNDLKRKVRTQYALSVSALAFQKLYEPLKHDLFRVEANDDPFATDKAQYFVLRPRYKDDPTAELIRKPYEGIKIKYESAIGLLPKKGEMTPARPLVCGAGIDNIGPTAPPVTVGQPRPRGTIGCFVRLRETGQTALLTSAFAIGAPDAAKTGDLIMNPPGSDNPQDIIGTLHSWIPVRPAGGSDGSEGNSADGAAVLLTSPVPPIAGFDTRSEPLPALREPREPRSKERVFKVGATSGVTRGVVAVTSAEFRMASKGESYVFTNTFGIRGDKPFMYPGDGGAIVVSEDGAILGLLFTGNRRMSFACSIRAVLERLGCDLILPTSPTPAAAQ